jgi:hypothetical protein
MHTQVLPDAATVESLPAAAVTAPSIHNMQPWRLRLDSDRQVLEVRSARGVPAATTPTDPAGDRGPRRSRTVARPAPRRLTDCRAPR